MTQVELVCLQLFLQTLLWVFGALAFREERSATLHWFAYAATATLATGLMSLRTGQPGWVNGPGATLAYFVSLLLACRGVEVFLRLRALDRVYLVMLVVAVLGLAWIGPAPDAARYRTALMSSLSVLLLVLVIRQAWRSIQSEFGLVMAVPAALSALAMGALHVAQVTRAWQHPEVLTATAVNVATLPSETWVLLLVSAAGFNYLFLFLVALRLVNTLRDQARLDPLTSLLNRRAMTHVLQAEWRRHQRSGLPFTLICVDLDFFKRINDEYGHAGGDEVLRIVATRLKAALRSNDRLARIGGEELLVLLPGCRADGPGRESADRVREALGREPVLLSSGQSVKVTASFGVSGARPGDVNVEQIMERADAALYRAKAAGRDCVVLG